MLGDPADIVQSMPTSWTGDRISRICAIWREVLGIISGGGLHLGVVRDQRCMSSLWLGWNHTGGCR